MICPITTPRNNLTMITIRRAKQEDCESVWHIHIRAIKEICKSHYTQEEIHTWSKVLKLSRYREGIRRGAFFVAVDGNAIVGFGNLNQESGEVEALYVDPDYVGLGVGGKILQAIESAAQDSGLTSLHLSSTLNAVRFYERVGFNPKKQSRYLLPFDMVACVSMVKELSSTDREPSQ